MPPELPGHIPRHNRYQPTDNATKDVHHRREPCSCVVDEVRGRGIFKISKRPHPHSPGPLGAARQHSIQAFAGSEPRQSPDFSFGMPLGCASTTSSLPILLTVKKSLGGLPKAEHDALAENEP